MIRLGIGAEHKKKLVLYSIGGNALSDPSKAKDLQDNEALKLVMQDVLDLLEAGFNIILTHGNGPQVGDLLSMEENNANNSRARTDLSTWVAATQGMIGHELSLELDSLLDIKSRPERTAVVLTRVRVDENDSAFANPTKPVGPILDKSMILDSWDVKLTERGLRRVVASPKPVEVLDLDLISPLQKPLYAGGIDAVGGKILSNLICSTSQRAAIACCGMVGGLSLDTSIFPFILRGLSLFGIDSAESLIDVKKEIWSNFSSNWKLENIDENIKDISLDELPGEIDRILKGEQIGRVRIAYD